MTFFSTLISPFSAFLSEDPNVAMAQAGLMALVVIILFLLFYTLRDIVLRTKSFAYQCFCILLVACVPVVGFLLYLLIRPARTVKEREMEAMLIAVTQGMFGEIEEEMLFEEVGAVVAAKELDESGDSEEREEKTEKKEHSHDHDHKGHSHDHDHSHHSH